MRLIKNLKVILFLEILYLLALSPLANAQTSVKAQSVKKTDSYSLFSSSSINKVDTISLDFKITSLVIQIDTKDNFNTSFIIAGKDTVSLAEDPHQSAETQDKFSNLVIFNKPVNSFIIYKGNITGKLNFHFINTGDTPKIYLNNNQRINGACDRPSTIDQSQWRAGLKPPISGPAYTKPKHIIVHHSAGSNTNTDYTYVVRQIYILHTQVNGWNDIAYNFLISQDGTIYEGREGSGPNEENALGAHFCAKNSETMGVCLLGHYDKVNPTEATLSSLVNLMAWKLRKENLDPLGASLHPSSSTNATSLGVIAGHRDGCTTECPGENVYTRLGELKTRTSVIINNSNGSLCPPVAFDARRCGPGVLTLAAGGANNGNFRWYTAALGGTPIIGATSASFTTPSLTTTTLYYVTTTNSTSESARVPVAAFIDLIPPSPEPITLERENPGSLTLKLNGSTELNYVWFTSPNLKDSIVGVNGIEYVTPLLFETTTYYVATKNETCFSPLVPVTAKINLDRPYIFPNPAMNEVTVALEGISNYNSLAIINAMGQQLSFSFPQITANKFTFNVSHLSRGVYILQMVSSQKSYSQRLIVQ